MKSILLLGILASSLYATQEVSLLDKIRKYYPDTKVLTKVNNVISRAGDAAVYHDDEANFFVQKGNNIYSLQKAFIGKELREIPKSTLATYLDQSYMTLNEFTDGNFSLQSSGRLVGGGAGGALVGGIIGKAGVHAVGHSLLYLVSFAAGPAQPAAFFALEGVLAPSIEAASVHAAVVMAIAGAVATGPV